MSKCMVSNSTAYPPDLDDTGAMEVDPVACKPNNLQTTNSNDRIVSAMGDGSKRIRKSVSRIIESDDDDPDDPGTIGLGVSSDDDADI